MLVPSGTADLYETVLNGLKRHWANHLRPRFDAQRDLTLLPGDSYFANILCLEPTRARLG